MIEKLVPIAVAVGLCFMFKSTRWVGIVAIAASSYFYPVPFLVIGLMAGIGYGIYWWRQGCL
jgi:hypothetical protein